MKPISVNTKLYFLLTQADGEVHSKEIEMGEKMMWHEAINQDQFSEDIRVLSTQNHESIFQECVTELLKFNKNDQVNVMAWMCLIANADGFMDKDEWQLIYRIYHKHLDLELNEIMQRQKELYRFIAQYRTEPDEKKEEQSKIKLKSSGGQNMAFPV
ncbi:MAG: TerB family tellurite resistance protein [Fulvivirga sp.]